ncbi:LAFA_0F10858g1_1 [Lachancea sp. 'fantastica']|nr:LAFA_0F10858g1_1 [Lachancea sp. 'fantastica']
MGDTRCPQCDSKLQKCLIQQNYSLVLCTNLNCGYPFNEREVMDNIVYTKDSQILDAAKRRLRKEEQEDKSKP